MSHFMERRISEYKTAPDVRRVKFGGADSRRALSRGASKSSGIPVRERKKMFEQTDSVYQTSGVPGFVGSGSVSGRRGSKARKEISRNSSFRGTKRLKNEDGSQSPVLGGRSKQLGSYNPTVPMWKKLRNFGHFDIQSLSIKNLSPSCRDEMEHNVKKPTGASAAHKNNEMDTTENGGISNNLVSSCPSFTNEVGGDNDWLSRDSAILLLKDSLSFDKQRRVGSREHMILDGEVPLKSMVHVRGPMNKQVSDMLLPKPGISYPFEFIDFGASYYRNYFLQHGESWST